MARLTATSTAESALPFVVSNSASNFTILLSDMFGPNTQSSGRTIQRFGVDTSAGNCFQTQFIFNGNNSTTSKIEMGINTLLGGSQFEIINNASGPFRFVNPSGPVAFTGAITLGTPLARTSGGTGLSTIGTNGQVLTVVSGAPAWVHFYLTLG
jgi:hypothetical protein